MLGANIFSPLRSRNIPKAWGRPPKENRDQNMAQCITQALFPFMLVAIASSASRLVANGWEEQKCDHVLKEIMSVHSVRRGWKDLKPRAKSVKGGFSVFVCLFR